MTKRKVFRVIVWPHRMWASAFMPAAWWTESRATLTRVIGPEAKKTRGRK